MSDFYQKAYAYLVGQIDGVIQYIEDQAGRETIKPMHILPAADMLKSALLTAEGRYIAGEKVVPIREEASSAP